MQLTSPRLVHIKFTSNDYEDFRKMEVEPEVVKYIGGEAASEEKLKEIFEILMRISDRDKHLGLFRVLNKDDDCFMGISKITAMNNKINPEITQAEIGYSLLPKYWGKGYGSEIVLRLIGYAKELGNINELIGMTHPENLASIKVMTKYGFTFLEHGSFEGKPSVTYKLILK